MDKKKRLRNWLRHHFHPMHIYCRLCDKMSDHKLAGKICIWYEYKVWKWIEKLIRLLSE